jgi:uncharacterized lipoprotein YddW (UPF0748 family)
MNEPNSGHRRMLLSFRLTRLLLACALASLVARSSADAQLRKPVPQKEIRGVWVHPSYFGTAQDSATVNIQRTLDKYRAAGINTLMLLVKTTSGRVCFKSTIAPIDSAWNWDFVGTFLTEAQKRDMVVHPWFCVFTEAAKAGIIRDHPEWLIRSRTMEPIGVVNPSLREIRSYEISIIMEFVRMYPVHWIHCDYIRYPCEPNEPFFSFDQETRDQFKLRYGEDPLSIRQNNSGNMIWNEWIEWDGEQVTKFMRELKASLRAIERPVQISAAVFPDAGISKVLIGQDWAQWAREGLVDLFCPMLYTNDDTLFVKYLRRSLIHTKSHGQVSAGIGIFTAHNQNTAAGVLRQIQLTKREKARGFVLFSSASLKQELLDEMKDSK